MQLQNKTGIFCQGVCRNGAVVFKPSSDENDMVIKEYFYLVKRIAHHLLVKLSGLIQFEDLMQAGMIGLIEAARNFDENKGASFATYASIRIKGAMLDEMRKEDWVPRSVYKKSRKMAQAVREVENARGRDARDSEVAQNLGINLNEYHRMLQNNIKIFAFEDVGINDETLDSSHIHFSPLERLQREDFQQKVAKEIAKLPEREKLVLALYYKEELNLREISEILGVSESRISQVHSQATLRLKSKLSKWI